MIGKIGRGGDTAGLLRYLFGPGRANEHTDPHLVAAWDELLPPDADGFDRARIKDLAALLDQPLALLERRPTAFVWHCSLRTAPGDPRLSDAQWAEISRDVLHRTGLARREDPDGCRWVAVRHAEDHVHLAVTLVHQDGRRARASHDFARVGAACREAEVGYGLARTAPRDGTAPRRPTRAETEKARREGRLETPRDVLRRQVRQAVLASDDLDSFLAELHAGGLQVRLRYSTTDPGVVTGYAVARREDCTSAGDLVWFGGGKLAPYLSLPRLAAIWESAAHGSARPARLAARSAPMRERPGSWASVLRSAAVITGHVERGESIAAAAAVVKVVSRTGESPRRR